jgi:hypothetical protein
MEISQYKIYIVNILLFILVVLLILGIVYAHDQYDKLYSKICHKNNTSICDSKIFCEQP